MGRLLNTEEALKILKDCYITDSVQTLRKWIREGKIIATGSPYKQEGYTIREEDLKAFIEEERPGLLDILRVYHHVNDRIPLGVSSIVKQQAAKPAEKEELYFNKEEEKKSVEVTFNESSSILAMLQQLQQQIEELHKKVETVSKEIHEKHEELEQKVANEMEQMKKKIENGGLVDLKNEMDEAKSKTKKIVVKGHHKIKTEEEFVTFFRKEFWNPNAATGKLKGRC
jgi:chromosome segregation ATPase